MRRAVDALGVFTFDFVPNSASIIPGYTTAQSPSGALLIVSGTANVTQYYSQALFSSVYNVEPFGIVNDFWSRQAANLGQQIPAFFPPDRPMIFVGHSYGAALAVLLHAGTASLTPRFLSYCGFGCPKVGYANFQEFVSKTNAVQVAGEDDPVLPLPPSVWLPAATFGIFGQWVTAWRPTRPNTKSSWIVNDDGLVAIGESPWSLTAAAFSLLERLNANDQNPQVFGGAHAIRTYFLRLRKSFPTWADPSTRDWLGADGLDQLASDIENAGL